MEKKDSHSPNSSLEHTPSDSAPEFGGALERTVRGKKVSHPVVKQTLMLTEGAEPKPIPVGDPLQSVLLVNTQGTLKTPAPIERQALEAARQFQDPITVRKADRQRAAIRRNIERRQKTNGRR